MASKDVGSKNNFNHAKQIILNKSYEIEENIYKLGSYGLQEQKRDLLKKVIDVREDTEKLGDNRHLQELNQRIEDLTAQVEHLRYEIEELTDKNKKLTHSLAIGEATTLWEAHLARFVIQDPRETIPLTRRFRHMKKYEKKMGGISRWNTIQKKLKLKWTDMHWDMVITLRDERNGIAHPGNTLDLDLIEMIIPRLEKDHQEPMRNMLLILKMTASLMKFGRLAEFYQRKKHLFPSLELSGLGKDALRLIISWDRNFEDIDGLLSIEHEVAKVSLYKYVHDEGMKNQCVKIVDFIKQGNSKPLGKLALEFEKAFPSFCRMSKENGEALDELKKLLPNPDDERNVKVLDATIAKLHIPDFLPKRLWEHGINIVEKYDKYTKT